MSSVDRTVDLKTYARILWRHKGLIALGPVAVFCVALIALAFVPDDYESSVILAVKDAGLMSKDVTDLTGGIMQAPTGYRVDEERMAKLSGRILSRDFLERVIRTLKMQEDPGIRKQAEARRAAFPSLSTDDLAVRILADRLHARIRFTTEGPGVYRVIVSDYNASNARLIAWWIGELYVDAAKQDALASINEAEVFAQDLLGRYDARLRNSEEDLQRSRTGIITRDLNQSDVRQENLPVAEALSRRMADGASQARILARSYADSLTGYGQVSDQRALIEDARVRDVADRLTAALWSEVTDRLAGNGTGDVRDWSPAGAYRSLRRDLLQLAETVVATRYPGASPELRGTLAGFVFSNVDAAVQQSAATELSASIALFRRQAESTPGGQIELARREGEVDRNRRLRDKVEDYIVGTDVRRSVETADLGPQIEILDPPRLPLSPTRPNRSKILLGALLLGVLLGAGFALLTETMDPVLRNMEDFARIVPEPLLGMTPLLSRHLSVDRSWLQRYWVPVTLGAILFVTGGFFLTRNQLFGKLGASTMSVRVVDPGSDTDANR
jgi:capsular polysaccharide biosynthesis protein